MQQRWCLDIAYTGRAQVSLSLDNLTNLDSTEIADLLFLQYDELTEDFLDAFEVHAPGYLCLIDELPIWSSASKRQDWRVSCSVRSTESF